MKYNYFVNGIKTSYTLFLFDYSVSLANSYDTIDKFKAKARHNIIIARKMLSKSITAVSWTHTHPIYKSLTFKITKAE